MLVLSLGGQAGLVGRHVTERNFENASLDELEVAMKCAPHQPGALRIRAIWAMGKGIGRPEVALFCNVGDKTVLEWINRFNDEGIDGLSDRSRSGAPRRSPQTEPPDGSPKKRWFITSSLFSTTLAVSVKNTGLR